MPDSGSRVDRGDPWPPFLDKLDSDPIAAKAQFVALSTAFLTVHPPPAMKKLEKYATPAGLIFELNERCCADDFKKLKTYKNTGSTLQSWLFVVAERWCRDLMKLCEREGRIIFEGELTHPDGDPAPLEAEPDPHKSPEAEAIDRERQELIDRCMKKMSPRCQFLLRLSWRGYTPREIVKMLPPPPLTNKQVGDQLSECRRCLVDLCREELETAGPRPGGIK